MLTEIANRSLEQCEHEIEEGANKARAALFEIYTHELWRNTECKSFAQYCRERWEWARTHAYRQIEAHKVQLNLSPIGDKSEIPSKESHLREIAQAPSKKQFEAMQRANEKAWALDRDPTAKDFKEAVKEITRDHTDNADVDELDMPAQVSPADLAVANACVGKRIVQKIVDAARLLKAVEDAPGTELLVVRENSIRRQLDAVQDAVKVTIPHSVCPRCNGNGCAQCGNMGWVNSVLARELNA